MALYAQTRDTAQVQRNQAPPAFLVKPISNVWRNRILAQLHVRQMSPKQFANGFGLSSATTARYFRELKDWGFLEVAEERRGGGRRGAVEKIYRAIRKVHFDNPTSAVLPLYLREELTEVVLEGLLPQITEALAAGSFDDWGHRSSQLISLDLQAWHELIDRLDEVLDWLSDLEAQSASRSAQADRKESAITVSLLCFRSSAGPVHLPPAPMQEQPPPRMGAPGPYFLMNPKTAKAVSEPWRNRILIELHARPMSPQQFLDEFGGPDLGTTARYFRQLRRWGHLEVLEKRPGRSHPGVVETIYRAASRPPLYLESWDSLPPAIKSRGSGPFVGTLLDHIHAAVATGTMDADTDRHLSWKSLFLDSQSRSECVTRLEEIQRWSQQLAAESQERLAPGKGEQIPVTLALLGF